MLDFSLQPDFWALGPFPCRRSRGLPAFMHPSTQAFAPARIHTHTHTYTYMLKCVIDLNTKHSIARAEPCTVKKPQRGHQRTVQGFVLGGSNREN